MFWFVGCFLCLAVSVVSWRGLSECLESLFQEFSKSFQGGGERWERDFHFLVRLPTWWRVCRKHFSYFPWQSPCRSLQLFQDLWLLRQFKLLWKQLVLFPDFKAWTHHRLTCYNSLFMHIVWVRSCFGRCSVKRCPRSAAANLPGSFSWQALWICAAQSLSPRHTERQTSSQTSNCPRLSSSSPWHC